MDYLAIDIGGSFIKYGVINREYQLEKVWCKKTKCFQNKDLFYDYLCEDLVVTEDTIVGVSTAGVISQGRIVTRASRSLNDMYQTNINQEIGKRLNKEIFALNDAEAAGVCETKIGSAKNTSSSVFWIIGTGIGGALFQGQKRVLGVDGISGEFSHISIQNEENVPQGIGSQLSVAGLINFYEKMSATNTETVDGKFIFDQYKKGNPHAIEAIDIWCEKMVQFFLLITYFYNPEVICIGGAVSQQEWLIQKLQKLFYQCDHAMKDIVSTKIIGCKYQGDANLLGGVLAARNYFDEKREQKIWIS